MDWIPIEKAVPKEHEQVLTCHVYERYYDVGFYEGVDDDGPVFIAFPGYEFVPTHWMRLPDMPKK